MKTLSKYMIDPPSSFANLEKWQEFRRGLERADQGDQGIIEAIKEADQAIAEKQKRTAAA